MRGNFAPTYSGLDFQVLTDISSLITVSEIGVEQIDKSAIESIHKLMIAISSVIRIHLMWLTVTKFSVISSCM